MASINHLEIFFPPSAPRILFKISVKLCFVLFSFVLLSSIMFFYISLVQAHVVCHSCSDAWFDKTDLL